MAPFPYPEWLAAVGIFSFCLGVIFLPILVNSNFTAAQGQLCRSTSFPGACFVREIVFCTVCSCSNHLEKETSDENACQLALLAIHYKVCWEQERFILGIIDFLLEGAVARQHFSVSGTAGRAEH